MHDFQLLINLAIITLTALLGGVAAQRVRQPALIGYLLSGIIVGPYGLGLIPEPEQIEDVATIGVAFLMFALGVELSLRTLLRSGRAVLVAGSAQMLATVALWTLVGSQLQWPLRDSLIFGYTIALGSTAIVLKLLLERGQLDSIQGRILMGIMLLQDLTVVPVMVLVSTVPLDLSGADQLSIAILALTATGKALGILAAMAVLGTVLAPRLLDQVARLRSRELFIITVFAMVIGTASAAVYLELSVALGAFIAGIIVSETEYSHQALADVVPLRDIFASFFFVSIGMLTDPLFVVQNVGLLALVIGVLLVAKSAVPGVALRLLGYPIRPSIAVATNMLPMGEFSFIVVGAGVSAGLISSGLLSLTLAAAIVTMFLVPSLVQLGNWFAGALTARSGLSDLDLNAEDRATLPETRHAVICGYGRTGQGIAALLMRRNFPCLVIDLDPASIREARRREVPHIYGDVSNSTVLQMCHLNRARIMIVAISDPLATDMAVRHALTLNPRLDIVARVSRRSSLADVRGRDNVALVEADFEAGLEVTRQALRHFGMSSQEIQLVLTSMRQGTSGL